MEDLDKETTLLIVEDDPNNVAILELDLEEDGYELITTENGLEGLEALEQDYQRISAVLLDRMMPVMDGMAFLEKVKADARFADIPVIMQTAAGEHSQVAEGIAAGVYYYLVKPFDEDVLRSIVRSAVQDFQRRRSLADALSQHQHAFGCVTTCQWELRTLEECKQLTPIIANHFPDPNRVLMGISELLINAVEHGNLGITYSEKTALINNKQWEDEIQRRLTLDAYKDRRVKIAYERGDDTVSLTISDDGEGFDWKNYIEFNPERITDSHGRGIAMANAMSFDTLIYQGAGNIVHCTVRIG